MRLWILQRLKGNAGYDVCRGMVVRASSESAARKTAHALRPNDDYYGNEGLWLKPKLSSCKSLTYSGEAGLILEDFLAG